MDTDIDIMTRDQLADEVKKLRRGIREHRDSTAHELCWHHPQLWSLLPERSDPLPVVPAWPQFLLGCIRYRQSLDEQLPHAARRNEPYRDDGNAIRLDHLMVPARNKAASAKLLAELLGVAWSETGVGPFAPVFVNDGLTIDFDEWSDPFPLIHYCFRVSEAGFDAILERIKAAGIAYRSRVHGSVDYRIDTEHGGRIVYWNEPDGHQWEMLTVSYARQPA